MIVLDGNHGEGGGAILRSALALSTLTQNPFRMHSIRKRRAKPGLKNQHLSCINSLVELCNANAIHSGLGSETLEFYPSEIKKEAIVIDIGTAGSITLLLQSLIPPILFSNRRVAMKIVGGTDVPHSPPIDYFINVFVPRLETYGAIRTWVERRGFYPKGGGIVRIDIEGNHEFKNTARAQPITLISKSKLRWINGKSVASMKLMQKQVAERIRNAARQSLGAVCPHVNIEAQYTAALSEGAVIVLWAGYDNPNAEKQLANNNKIILSADLLAQRGVASEQIGAAAAANLLSQMNSPACADSHLADQLVLYMGAIAQMSGRECKLHVSGITEHFKSNVYVAEQFLEVKFRIAGNLVVCNRKNS